MLKEPVSIWPVLLLALRSFSIGGLAQITMISSSDIKSALKTILDPELGYNIVDLGLVYDIKITEPSTLNPIASIQIIMTLTSPGCPLAPFFVDQVKQTISQSAACSPDQVIVTITFDPPWSQEALSEEMKLNLGL